MMYILLVPRSGRAFPLILIDLMPSGSLDRSMGTNASATTLFIMTFLSARRRSASLREQRPVLAMILDRRSPPSFSLALLPLPLAKVLLKAVKLLLLQLLLLPPTLLVLTVLLTGTEKIG
jgi:hypothetical protein